MDGIKEVATQLWYRYIAGRLGSASAYEVEKTLEPHVFGRNADGTPFHAGKWTKYAAGKRYPRPESIDGMEDKVPGSKSILQHPLWDLLRDAGCTSPPTDVVRRLLPDIQVILLQSDATGTGELTRRDIDDPLLDALEDRAGLDALAALTTIYLESIGKAEWPMVSLLRVRLYRMLLIISIEEPLAWVSLPLFNVYAWSIFPLASADGRAFWFERSDFTCTCSTLMLSIARCTHGESAGTAKQRIALARGVLDGRFGRNLHNAFVPGRVEAPINANFGNEALEQSRRAELLRLAGIGQILRDVDRWFSERDGSEDHIWPRIDKILGIHEWMHRRRQAASRAA